MRSTVAVGGLLRAEHLRRDGPADRLRVWPVRLAERARDARLLSRRHRRLVLHLAAGPRHRLLHADRLQSLAPRCQGDRQRVAGTINNQLECSEVLLAMAEPLTAD